MSRRERGQGLVEAVMAVPVCVACALAIVDAGVLVRDRLAVAQAADRAAVARLEGRDERAAALRALPGSLRRGATVRVDGATVEVRVDGGARLAQLVGHPIRLDSSVEVER